MDDLTDLKERVVRLETKLDFIIAAIDRLPPSPHCQAKHQEYEARFTQLEQWRNMAVGAFLVVNILFVFFMDKIRNWIS